MKYLKFQVFKTLYFILIVVLLVGCAETIDEENTKETSSSSNFISGVDNWTIEGDAEGEIGVIPNFSKMNGVGNSGYIYATDDATDGVWYFVAPPKYHGDKSKFFNGKLEFYLIQDSIMKDQFSDKDVVIEGESSEKIVYKHKNYPTKSWTKYEINLNTNSHWLDENGDIASNTKIKTVLSNITKIMIRGEFEDGEDIGGLDGFKFREGENTKIPSNDVVDIVSNFTRGVDDWKIEGDAKGGRGLIPNFSRDNGVKDSGYIYAIDDATDGVWYFVAPSKYLGDKSKFFNGKLEFYLIQDSEMADQFSEKDVILKGVSGEKITYEHTKYPTKTWTNYTITLNTNSQWLDENDDIASDKKIRSVLSNITKIMIRGEFEDGEDIGGLDSFKFSN